MRTKMILASFVIVGCGTGAPEIGPVLVSPTQAAYVSSYTQSANEAAFAAANPTSTMVASVVGAVGLVNDNAVSAASAAAANGKMYFVPDGCANVTAEERTVTYVLDDCTGPFGSTHIKGAITATFMVNPDGLELDLEAKDLLIGAATVNFNRHMRFAQAAGLIALTTLTNESTAQGSQGNVKSSASKGILSWGVGGGCTTYNGTETVQLEATTLNAAFTGVVRCANPCPQSGSVKVTDSGGGGVTLNFNGMKTVPVSRTDGAKDSVTLACGS